jgi:hypothetical protein
MHRAGSGKFSILRLIPEARRTCAPAQARQCASVRRREGSLDQGKSAPKTTRRRKKALGCGHAPSRKRQILYPAPDTGSPAYLRSCPSATVRKCEAKRRQFGKAIYPSQYIRRRGMPAGSLMPGGICGESPLHAHRLSRPNGWPVRRVEQLPTIGSLPQRWRVL